jgi:hypothetical protein
MHKKITYNRKPKEKALLRRKVISPETSLILLPPGCQSSRSYTRHDDAFKVLGVSPETSTREIKQAYLRLARQYHPDLNHDREAAIIFKEITRAYESILRYGDLLRLKLKCDVVETKALYAGQLMMEKRTQILTGIKIEHQPAPPNTIQNEELYQRMQKLGQYLSYQCPLCRFRVSCNRATGFAEVEDLHLEIQRQMEAQAARNVGQMLRRLFGLE